jgi:hypothetical protein
MEKQPSMLYKYRSFSVTTLESLCRDSLYFAHPGTFNDPLDCNPTIECDSETDELKKLLVLLIEKRVSKEVSETLKRVQIQGKKASIHSEKIARTEAENKLASIAYHATNPDYEVGVSEAERWLIVQEIEHELKRHYDRGVCCFSTNYSSPVLWSHYGDQHKGICIGYSLDRNPRPNPQKVVYGKSRSVTTSTLVKAFLNESKEAMEHLDQEIFLRKAKGWSYEKEWRLIDKKGIQNSPLLLKEITFGLRCTISVIHSIVQSLSGRKSAVNFYEMYEVRGNYTLRRREVDLCELDASMPMNAEFIDDLADDDAL